MIIGNVMGSANDIALPEGMSRNSPFATNKVHKLSTPELYMLEHPCVHIRALEHIFTDAFNKSTNQLKTRYGLESINNVILTKNENGEKSNIKLHSGLVSTYWGLFSLFLATTVPQVFKQIFPDVTYPIGFTKLDVPAVIFKKHVPVITNGSQFNAISHCLHFAVDQEIKKRFIYAVFPFIEQNPLTTPILYLKENSKLEKQLMDVIEKKGFQTIDLNWDSMVHEFSNILDASLLNDPTMLEVQNPISKLYQDLNTQPDSISFARAITLISTNAHKPNLLEIIPTDELTLYPLPVEPSQVRKEKAQLLAKQEALRQAMSQENTQDLSALVG